MNLNVNIVVKYLKGLQMLGELFGSVLGVKKKQAEYFRQATSPSMATTQKTAMDQQKRMILARTEAYTKPYAPGKTFNNIISKLERRIKELETELAIERELSIDLYDSLIKEINTGMKYSSAHYYWKKTK